MSLAALRTALPGLPALPWAALGSWPTPIEPFGDDGRIWIKREDHSDPRYGGNKLRTLEPLLGTAIATGATEVWATGAYGSNQALATAVHAPRLSLAAGALLFPQPPSVEACGNARELLGTRASLVVTPHATTLPWAAARLARARRAVGARPVILPPGGASPAGVLGALGACLEVALQVRAHVAPAPAQIVLPVGSGCTTAGLLAGAWLAEALGWWRAPLIIGVRVTPWPVTSPTVIVALAHAALARLAAQTALPRRGLGVLRRGLVVDGDFLGAGYGYPTAAGWSAHRGWPTTGDGIYANKALAALTTWAPRRAPTLLWATKSAAPASSAHLRSVDAPPALVTFARYFESAVAGDLLSPERAR